MGGFRIDGDGRQLFLWMGVAREVAANGEIDFELPNLLIFRPSEVNKYPGEVTNAMRGIYKNPSR